MTRITTLVDSPERALRMRVYSAAIFGPSMDRRTASTRTDTTDPPNLNEPLQAPPRVAGPPPHPNRTLRWRQARPLAAPVSGPGTFRPDPRLRNGVRDFAGGRYRMHATWKILASAMAVFR